MCTYVYTVSLTVAVIMLIEQKNNFIALNN